MHTVKTILAASVVALGLFSHPIVSQAFDGDRSYRSEHGCWRSCHRFEQQGGGRLADCLNLTQEQRASIKAIYDKYRPELRELRQLQSDNRKALAKMDATDTRLQELAEAQGKTIADTIVLRKKMRDEMGAILTADQRQKLHEMFGHRRHQHRWHDAIGHD